VSAPDADFLRVVIQAVRRLQETCAERGHPLLASLLDIARAEAEDDLRTDAQNVQLLSRIQQRDSTLSLLDHLEAELHAEIAQLGRAS
jgi:hypothetical protein